MGENSGQLCIAKGATAELPGTAYFPRPPSRLVDRGRGHVCAAEAQLPTLELIGPGQTSDPHWTNQILSLSLVFEDDPSGPAR